MKHSFAHCTCIVCVQNQMTMKARAFVKTKPDKQACIILHNMPSGFLCWGVYAPLSQPVIGRMSLQADPEVRVLIR